MTKATTNKLVLLLLAFFISALFLSMIRPFLMALFLAGIFSGLFYPVYRFFERRLKGRRLLSSVTTIVLIVILVVITVAGLLGIVSAQAVKVGHTARPWVERQIAEPEAMSRLLQMIPFREKIEPYQQQILSTAGEMVGSVSRFLISQLQSIAFGTVNFLFMTFITLYAMIFFLMEGDRLINKILYYLPLKDEDKQRMLAKFTSVTRATIKGTLIIGIIQGALAGAAFAVAGIPSSVFWAAVMAVLSIIPGIGTALVWVPAAIIWGAAGHVPQAIGLAVFCGAVVGSVDNLLRPILVGKDTQMHELMILLGTLGGIMMFGIAGFFIGPIIAALFVTVWEMYGVAFKDVLPPVRAAAIGTTESLPETTETGGAGKGEQRK